MLFTDQQDFIVAKGHVAHFITKVACATMLVDHAGMIAEIKSPLDQGLPGNFGSAIFI